MNPRLRREMIRFWRFSVVGAIGAVVDFGAFNLLRGGLEVPATLAQAFSFTLAVFSNFLWNRYWTYPDSRSKPLASQAGQFLLVNLIGLAIRTPVFVLTQAGMVRLSEQLLAGYSLPVGAAALGSNLALAIAVIVVLFWNFGVNRVWTYSDVD